MFSRNDLDLEITTVVKCKNNLIEYTPLKEHYRQIPPGMYKEVRAHVQQMLDIGSLDLPIDHG